MIKQNKLILLPVLLILLICIPVFKWGIADINAYPVRYAIKDWQADGRIPSYDELEHAQTAITKARKWDDKNPEYIDYEARLFHYQALIASNELVRDSALINALDAYRLSTTLRPNWPYSWANLALIKALRSEIDQEYLNALRQAVKYGPWENGVNLAVTEAGIIGWNNLQRNDRELVIENIQRGSRRNLKHIKVILNRYNGISRVCANLPQDTARSKLCGF